MNHLFLLSLFSWLLVHAAAEEFQHNTFGGVPITPENLLELAPAMPASLDEKVQAVLTSYPEPLLDLTRTPRPFSPLAHTLRSSHNKVTVEVLKRMGLAVNLGGTHHVLQFKESPEFTMHINRFGSRVAALIYSSDQGSILSPDFDRSGLDYAKLAEVTPLQDMSKVAHYLRFSEVAQKESFEYLHVPATYLTHLPTRPDEVSDENYIVVQEWVPGLTELKKLDEREQIAQKKNIPPRALEEKHKATVYAALWNHMNKNLSIGPDGNYYFVNIQGPFNNHAEDFYYQGERGEEKYALDVRDALERMLYGRTADQPKAECHEGLKEVDQVEKWKQMTRDHHELMALFEKHKCLPRFLS